jgi:hypothetical protein
MESTVGNDLVINVVIQTNVSIDVSGRLVLIQSSVIELVVSFMLQYAMACVNL